MEISSELIIDDNRCKILGNNNQYWNSTLLPWFQNDTLFRYWWYFGWNQDWLLTNIKGHQEHNQIGNKCQTKINIISVISMIRYNN